MLLAPMLRRKPPKPPCLAPMLRHDNPLMQKEKPPKPPLFARAYIRVTKKAEQPITAVFFRVINNGGYGGYGGLLRKNNNLETSLWGPEVGLLGQQWGLLHGKRMYWKKITEYCLESDTGCSIAKFFIGSRPGYLAYVPNPDYHTEQRKARYAIGEAIPQPRTLLGCYDSASEAQAACRAHQRRGIRREGAA